jgi:capsular polysaccharide biosynthesis protein
MRLMSAKDWLLIFRKRWRLLFLFPLLFVAVAAYFSYFVTSPIYTNTCTLLVNEQNKQNNSLSVEEVMLYEKLMGTYKDVIMSKRILQPVAAEYKNGITPGNINQFVKVSTKANSQVISISVYFTNHRIATDLANKVADQFKNNLKFIMTVDNVQILDYASYEDNPVPVKPNKKMNILLGLFLGFGFSTSLIVLLYLLDTRIRNENDLSDILHYPLLGSVPSFINVKRKTFYH